MLDENRDVGLARAKRRNGNGDHVEAVVQVFPEGARAHGGAQIHVGRREHAQIDRNGMRAAQPLDLPLLEGAEKFGLEIDAQRAHLVQEERAPVGELELAHLARMRPREGALLVPEELGFEEGVRDGGKVHRHERLGTPRPLSMYGTRHQLLPRAALRRDQDGGGRLRHLRDQLVELDHGRVTPDERIEAVGAIELGAEVMYLALEHPALRRLPHEGEDLVHVEGLGHVVVGAALDRFHGRPHIFDRGDDDHGDALVESEDLREEGRSGRPRHPHVEEHHVHPAPAQHLDPIGTLLRLEHFELTVEDEPKGLAHTELVVDDERDGARPGWIASGVHGLRACWEP